MFIVCVAAFTPRVFLKNIPERQVMFHKRGKNNRVKMLRHGAAIAAAVEEGRRVYDNLIKFLAFVLPTNLGLACILSVSLFFFPSVLPDGLPVLLLAMSPTQTLWINLVASVTLSIPLAFEVLEPGAMRRPPRAQNESLFSAFILLREVVPDPPVMSWMLSSQVTVPLHVTSYY